jgi:hypothetical protein
MVVSILVLGINWLQGFQTLVCFHTVQLGPSSQSICAYYVVPDSVSGQQRVMKFNYLPNRALTETVDVKGLDDCLEKEKTEVFFLFTCDNRSHFLVLFKVKVKLHQENSRRFCSCLNFLARIL